MTYIEYVFVCMAAPLLTAMLCTEKRNRTIFCFCIAGMGMCLLSAYINTFFAGIYHADMIQATTEIAPVVEEIMKFLPLLFYLLVWEPEVEKARTAVIVVAASFATFENVCYLTQNGAENLAFLLIRGFGTGAMHVVCGALVACGLLFVWSRPWLRAAGTLGLLCAAITVHAIYNLLLSAGGVIRLGGSVMPAVLLAVGIMALRRIRREQAQSGI
ncbi:MAG: PrsW family glutamic-type intramembrane protease [Lachnospiraceae bacterium]|nr:PrsW family glutamic-type intramembrane protease [Lachnospiraceae bacterium]